MLQLYRPIQTTVAHLLPAVPQNPALRTQAPREEDPPQPSTPTPPPPPPPPQLNSLHNISHPSGSRHATHRFRDPATGANVEVRQALMLIYCDRIV